MKRSRQQDISAILGFDTNLFLTTLRAKILLLDLSLSA
jgi:hypothetical protein